LRFVEATAMKRTLRRLVKLLWAAFAAIATVLGARS
jgi:hypothetical protein